MHWTCGLSFCRRRWVWACWALALVLAAASPRAAGGGLRPIRYDDCGSPGRQPHVAAGSMWTYPEDEMSAPLAARTVAFHAEAVRLRYPGLAPTARYRLRMVCGTKRGSDRRQDIEIEGTVVRRGLAPPQGRVERLELDVPPEAVADGVLNVCCRKRLGPFAILSEVWLLSDVPQPELSVSVAPGPANGTVAVAVRDALLQACGGAVVTVVCPDGAKAEARASDEGTASVDLSAHLRRQAGGELVVTARWRGIEAVQRVAADEVVVWLPVLTPFPKQVLGVDAPSQSLSGTWRFAPAPSPDFHAADTDDSGWARIGVPGEWMMQGFTVAPDTAAGYRRRFTVPADWAGHRVKLRFDAVYSHATVWVNGQEAGRHMGGFTPFELDVTDLVKTGGANVLAVAVRKESLTDQKFTTFGAAYAATPMGGISRKVTLFAVPTLHVASLHVATTFGRHYRDATLRAMLEVRNQGSREVRGAKIRLALTGRAASRWVLPRRRWRCRLWPRAACWPTR